MTGQGSVISGFQVSWGHSQTPCLSPQACTQTGFHCVLVCSRAHLPPLVRTWAVFRTVLIPANCAEEYILF